MTPCHECGRSSDEGVCDRCLARMFEPRTEIPHLRAVDTGPRPIDPVADALAEARAAVTRNRPTKGKR